MPKRTIHKFKKVNNARSRKPAHKHTRQILNDALNNTTIKLGTSNASTSTCSADKVEFSLDDLGVSARIDLCPKVN